LNGSPNATTEYLRTQTSGKLTEAFSPIVEASLAKVNATKYYGDLVGRYNKIPFVQKANPDLKGYVTQKAMDGLFLLIAQEEQKIRDKAEARKTDLLKKVFTPK
jgi:Protein of unknown function (DUF4197)